MWENQSTNGNDFVPIIKKVDLKQWVKTISSESKNKSEEKIQEKTEKAKYIEKQRSFLALMFFSVILLNLFVKIYFVPKYEKIENTKTMLEYQYKMIEDVGKQVLSQKSRLADLTEKSKSVILPDDSMNPYYITNYLNDIFLTNSVQLPNNFSLSEVNEWIRWSIVFIATKESWEAIISTLWKQNWATDKWSFSPVTDASLNSNIKLYNFQVSLLIPIWSKN